MNVKTREEEPTGAPLLQIVEPPTPERRRPGPLPYVLVLLPGLLLALSAIVEDYFRAPGDAEEEAWFEPNEGATVAPNERPAAEGDEVETADSVDAAAVGDEREDAAGEEGGAPRREDPPRTR